MSVYMNILTAIYLGRLRNSLVGLAIKRSGFKSSPGQKFATRLLLVPHCANCSRQIMVTLTVQCQ